MAIVVLSSSSVCQKGSTTNSENANPKIFTAFSTNQIVSYRNKVTNELIWNKTSKTCFIWSKISWTFGFVHSFGIGCWIPWGRYLITSDIWCISLIQVCKTQLFFTLPLKKWVWGQAVAIVVLSSSSVCQKGKGWEVYELPIKPTLNEKSVFEIEKKGKNSRKKGS